MSTALNKKIEIILQSNFSIKNFVELICELFPSVKIVAPDSFSKEHTNFAPHIDGSIHVGNFTTPDGKKLIIMAVRQKNGTHVESARSMQRSYAKKLIENGNADAALIAFFTEGAPLWRLSLVRLDYELKLENGHLKTSEKITPAKRFSFLVGDSEPCHTAISRLSFFATEGIVNADHPTLDDIEEIFSVEQVTSEFFGQYCEKYLQLRDQLESTEDFQIEATQHSFSASQFAKKLMGQIVFLYFLQKKGWLGVKAWPEKLDEASYQKALYARGSKSRELIPVIYRPTTDGFYRLSAQGLSSIGKTNEEILSQCVSGNPWGSGPRNFMRKLFNIALERKVNFYNDLLKPLFYDALNHNRGNNGYYHALECRIPFLAGGLFEPINGHDWEHSNFSIPNEMFSNAHLKGRDADGILDVFDRYNFTMSEDEPLEREVAIDPEMLGKVFENLLEVKDRKSMGAFYTPREIVQYMCQESLINYLTQKTGIAERDIRVFVLHGNFLSEADSELMHASGRKEFSIPQNLFSYDDKHQIVVNRLAEIDHALATIRVVDPAVGSGAFPLCMINEIVKLRHAITTYLTFNFSEEEKSIYYQNGRTIYQLKLNAIKNCIYGVDNDPSAVDIARLRLWLSLIIESDSTATTLPHLDNNIICSNSLSTRYCANGRFGDIINEKASTICAQMNHPAIKAAFDNLFVEEGQLFVCDNPTKKREHLENVIARKASLLKHLAKESQEILYTYAENLRKTSRAYTIWPIDFAKVFIENNGFDIVIGNPPYIQLQKALEDGSGAKVGDQYIDSGFQTFVKSGDLYCLFYELGISILRDGGTLSYITSNKWMRTAYGEPLRSYFAKNCDPKKLIDFSGTRVFDTAGVDVNILLLEKSTNKNATTVCTIKEPLTCNVYSYVDEHSATMSFNGSDKWNILPDIEEAIKKKILSIGKPLSSWKISIKYGIKTCLNKVYVIDEDTKQQLCKKDPKSAEILSPVLRGRDINKWECNFRNLWLIAVHNGIHKYNVPPVDIDQYTAVKEYLTPYMAELKKRIDQGITPYHLKNCTYYEEYALPKIVFQEIEQAPSFALDAEGRYMCLDTVRIITGEHLEYLVALLNSNLFFFAVKHFFGGGGLGGSGVRMKHTFFKEFSAYIPTAEEEAYIKNIVLSNAPERDHIINEFFYEKYDISESEKIYIESEMKQVKS